MNSIRHVLQGCLVAILATTLVVTLGGHFLGEEAPLLFFIVPVVAAWSGGLRAGLFAIVLSVPVAAYFFLDIYRPEDQIRIVLFIAAAVLMCWLVESLHAARRRVEQHERQLEHEVAERKEMERALQEADRRKDEFLATLAHELRNPLAPLANSLELWPIAEGHPAELERLRQIMEAQVKQMTRLIDDLLDISRITRGRIELRNERVDLRTLIAAAVDTIERLVQAQRQVLLVELPDEPLYVDGDAARLTQVFGNVLHNASKFTPAEGTIAVAAAAHGERIEVRIRDTGPGIPTNMLSDIFEMFRQLDETLHRTNGGLGIGLSLAKKLVEVHGGSIEARSSGASSGSEFIIRLPLPPRQPLATINLADKASHTTDSLPRRRILVVDDTRACAETLAMMLRSIGQEVAVAADGAAAIEWVLANEPDVVFLDIAMPAIDGYEVARRLRARAGLKPPTLIAVTGFGQAEDRRRAYAAGFHHHLTKPATLASLKNLLASIPRDASPESRQAVHVEWAT
jgi:signal transduction histidine kinase/AmiR/NasT family two-component response regulator